MRVQSYQKKLNLSQEEQDNQMNLENMEDRLERVWKDIEKILDHFEEDFKMSQEKLNLPNEQALNKAYFSWGI